MYWWSKLLIVFSKEIVRENWLPADNIFCIIWDCLILLYRCVKGFVGVIQVLELEWAWFLDQIWHNWSPHYPNLALFLTGLAFVIIGLFRMSQTFFEYVVEALGIIIFKILPLLSLYRQREFWNWVQTWWNEFISDIYPIYHMPRFHSKLARLPEFLMYLSEYGIGLWERVLGCFFSVITIIGILPYISLKVCCFGVVWFFTAPEPVESLHTILAGVLAMVFFFPIEIYNSCSEVISNFYSFLVNVVWDLVVVEVSYFLFGCFYPLIERFKNNVFNALCEAYGAENVIGVFEFLSFYLGEVKVVLIFFIYFYLFPVFLYFSMAFSSVFFLVSNLVRPIFTWYKFEFIEMYLSFRSGLAFLGLMIKKLHQELFVFCNELLDSYILCHPSLLVMFKCFFTEFSVFVLEFFYDFLKALIVFIFCACWVVVRDILVASFALFSYLGIKFFLPLLAPFLRSFIIFFPVVICAMLKFVVQWFSNLSNLVFEICRVFSFSFPSFEDFIYSIVILVPLSATFCISVLFWFLSSLAFLLDAVVPYPIEFIKEYYFAWYTLHYRFDWFIGSRFASHVWDIKDERSNPPIYLGYVTLIQGLVLFIHTFFVSLIFPIFEAWASFAHFLVFEIFIAFKYFFTALLKSFTYFFFAFVWPIFVFDFYPIVHISILEDCVLASNGSDPVLPYFLYGWVFFSGFLDTAFFLWNKAIFINNISSGVYNTFFFSYCYYTYSNFVINYYGVDSFADCPYSIAFIYPYVKLLSYSYKPFLEFGFFENYYFRQ